MEVGYSKDATLSFVKSYYEEVKGINDVQIVVEHEFFKNKLTSLTGVDCCFDFANEPLLVVSGNDDEGKNITDNITPNSLKTVLDVVLKDEPFTIDEVDIMYRRMGDCTWPMLDFNGIKLEVTPKTKIKQKTKIVQK